MIALLTKQKTILLMSIACVVCWGLAGCKQHHPKALPAPLLDNAQYELEGRVRRIWDADSFEFGELNELHYIVIRGVDTPKPGQPYFDQAKEHLIQSVRRRTTRISIVGRDSMMREFADVYSRPKNTPDAIEMNVGLDLIEQGLGWYDGTEFEDDEAFKQAELDAREKRIGLWAQDAPVAPWDFEDY